MNILRGVEAILFVADSPAKPEDIAEALQVPVYAVEEALEKLGAHLEFGTSLQLVRIAGGYQLCTKPQFAEAIARYVKPKSSRMSRSLMETLAIVAYSQPVTAPEIDKVRGVDSHYALGQLLERRLIRDVGRKQTPGRPVLYGTTQQFLHQFALEDLDHLPPVEIGAPVLETVDGIGHEDQPRLPAEVADVQEVDQPVQPESAGLPGEPE